MKILVINGSPKKENSDTMHITRAFLDGMNEVSQNEVSIIHAIDKHIEYCKGCFACMRNGGDCIHNDDMRDILEEILNSDLLIWSFPLYCYGMPAPMKALLRISSTLHGLPSFTFREYRLSGSIRRTYITIDVLNCSVLPEVFFRYYDLC